MNWYFSIVISRNHLINKLKPNKCTNPGLIAIFNSTQYMPVGQGRPKKIHLKIHLKIILILIIFVNCYAKVKATVPLENPYQALEIRCALICTQLILNRPYTALSCEFHQMDGREKKRIIC